MPEKSALKLTNIFRTLLFTDINFTDFIFTDIIIHAKTFSVKVMSVIIMSDNVGSLIYWLLDLSLNNPRAAYSSMQRSIGIMFVIMFRGSPGEDGRAPVISGYLPTFGHFF